MNKTILRNLSIALGLFFAPLAFASTVDLSPTTVNIEPGKTFTVQVYINPQSNTYSSKVELKYPADLLQVSSFVINDSWMALKQSGYDAMDNVNGVLLKSGGYPGGFTSKILFGTVTFNTVKAGSATISIGSNTNIPNVSNVNTLTDSPSVVVSIIAPVVIQPTTITTEKTSTTKVTQQTTQPTTQLTQEVEEEPAQQEVAEEDNSSEAQASLASTSSVWGNSWLWLLALVVIGFVIYIIYRKNEKK
jgi:hypothetical protein